MNDKLKDKLIATAIEKISSKLEAIDLYEISPIQKAIDQISFHLEYANDELCVLQEEYAKLIKESADV